MKKIGIFFLTLILLFTATASLFSCGEAPQTTVWFYGAEKPDDTVEAKVGDFYFEYGDCDVHVYTESGWEKAFTMKGDNGKNGKDGKDGVSWLYGVTAPKQTDGKKGDFYINTENLTLYVKENSWKVITRFTKKHFYDYENDSDKTLKILCIGNSFSVDTMNYVYQILQDVGITNVVLGNLYIGGCSTEKHYTNIIEDNADYKFYYNDSGKWKTTDDYTIKQALELDEWDFISFQQKSSYSGKPDKFNELQPLANEVRKLAKNSTFFWHMTWAYQNGYSGLSGYDNDQMTMYNAIVDTVNDLIVPNTTFDFVAPVGTAIQNARTSSLGDSLNRDGTHLDQGVGRYTAALTLVGAVTGRDVSEVTWRPTEEAEYKYPVSQEEQRIAIESAVNALKSPYSVTESVNK